MGQNINDLTPASPNNIPSPDNVVISGVTPVHTSVFRFHHTQTDVVQSQSHGSERTEDIQIQPDMEQVPIEYQGTLATTLAPVLTEPTAPWP